MTFDWWTLGLQAVNVLVLLWLLSHILFRPVAAIIAERQAAATQDLDRAHEVQLKADAMLADAKAQLDAVAETRAAMLEEARSEAERERTRILEQARQTAGTLLAEAQDRAERQREAVQAAMRREASELALDIAGRLLDRLPPSARVDGFIDDLANAVARLPESTRAGIGADGPVIVRAAAMPTGDEKDRLARRLAEVLGRPVKLGISVDESLIAGLELDAPHAIVRNHFRADLDRIRKDFGDD